MKFHLTIAADNAAFDAEAMGPGAELGRILANLGAALSARGAQPGDTGLVRDINGNTVGNWHVTGGRVPLDPAPACPECGDSGSIYALEGPELRFRPEAGLWELTEEGSSRCECTECDAQFDASDIGLPDMSERMEG